MSATNTLETLKAMDALLDSPDRWTQGQLARTENRLSAEPNSSHAVCWCLSGAAMKALGINNGEISEGDQFYAVINALHKVFPSGFDSTPLWNDTPGRTFAEVKDLIARAIASEQSA